MPVNPYQTVENMKNMLPSEVEGMSDYDVFEYVKDRFPEHQGKFSGAENPFQKTQIPAPPKDTKTFEDSPYDPSTFNKMVGWMNFADMYAEEGEGVEAFGGAIDISPWLDCYMQQKMGNLSIM